MAEPVVTVQQTLLSYCVLCGDPARVGVITLIGWPYGAPVCAQCLREIAVKVELNGTPPTRARVAETND